MSMFRIVGQQIVNGKKTGGVLFSGKRLDNVFDVRIFEVNGHRELSARQCIEWTELGDYVPHRDALGNLLEPESLTDKEIQAIEEERRSRCLKKAAQRAQTQCRRLIKASNFREMLTITYRENQQDRELCKKHFKEWVRRMKNALPKFQYCASFERQDRGAMHVHCATNKLPKHCHYKGIKIESWTLGTTIWREIVGADNGLVFVGGKPRWGDKRRRNLSLARIASYVSKYIMKDFEEGEPGSNRYSRSNTIDLPESTVITLHQCGIDDLIRLCFEIREGDQLVSHRVGKWGDSYWLCTEPEKPH